MAALPYLQGVIIIIIIMMNLNRFFYGLIVFSALSVTPGCSNEEQLSLDGTAEARTPLSISVTNAGLTKVGGVVSGSQFGNDVSLGLFLTKEDGSSPYDEPYNNIQYVSSNSGQTWTATSPILLTGTKANVYAYYPYSSTATNIEAIPIDVTQNQDVMWATPYSGAYNASPTATLQMNHALSVIRFSLSKGDYSDAGNLTSITIKGDCMAKTGTLNAKTGAVTPTDGGTEIDLGAAATLSSTPTNVEQLVIPTNASGNISVTIQMARPPPPPPPPPPPTPEQSKAYKFGLAFSDSKLTMSTVTIGTIDEVDKGNMTPVVGGVPTITWAEAKATDGVYGIYEGKPAVYNEAKKADEGELEGVAIVMYGRALQISHSGLTDDQYWGKTSVKISGIKDVSQTGGGVTGYYGYLPQADGSYGTTTESYKIKADHTTWQNYSSTALADTCGWSNTKALITAHSGKTPSSSYIGAATADFRNGANSQGFTDWFVPAAGQLAYMCLNVTEINTLLDKCGGTSLPMDWHWSSSEYTATGAWCVNFSDSQVCGVGKDGRVYVRFCRDITE